MRRGAIDANIQITGYTLAGEVGRGGFGVVHRARQAGLDRDVAIKVLSAGRLDETATRRFERECRVLGRLSDHPNIVTVHGSGFTDAGAPFIAMEFLAQGSLADRLAADGALPWQEAVTHVVKVAGALETAHRAGVLHRDVKPENVLLSSYGEPLLADFGIARVDDGTRTQAGAVTASLGHAAPEVLDGHDPSAASDVYALGSTLFQLVAGHMAFDPEGGVVAMVGKVLNRPVPDLRERGIPASICLAIESAMAKSAEDRPATAESMAGALIEAAAQAGHTVAMPRIGTTQEPSTTSDPSPAPPAEPTRVHARVESPPVAAAPAAPAAPAVPAVPTANAAPAAPVPATPSAGAGGGRPRWIVPVVAGAALLGAILVGVNLLGGNDEMVAGGQSPDASASPTPPGADQSIDPSTPALTSGQDGADRITWTRDASIDGNAPLLVQGLGGVVLATHQRALHAFDAADGTPIWRTDVDVLEEDPTETLLLSDGQSVLVPRFGGRVAVDLRAGTDLFRVSSDYYAGIEADVLVMSSVSGATAFDPNGGAELWAVDPGGLGGLLKVGGASDSGGLVLVDAFQFLVVDPATGEELVRYENRRMITGLAITGNVAYVAATASDSALVDRVDLVTGQVVTLREDAGFDQAWIDGTDDRVVYLANQELVVLGGDSGTTEWFAPLTDAQAFMELTPNGVVIVEKTGATARFARYDLYGSGTADCEVEVPAHQLEPVVGDDNLYVTTDDGRLLAFDLVTCGLSWSYDVPGGASARQPFVLDGGGLGYLVATDGALTAFRLWDN